MALETELGLNFTPAVILQKQFNTKFRGYDMHEVDTCLDVIINDYEVMLNEINKLNKQLQESFKNQSPEFVTRKEFEYLSQRLKQLQNIVSSK